MLSLSCSAQIKADLPKDDPTSAGRELKASEVPSSISRNIIQDRKGNIWVASFGGVYRYDGSGFTNVTRDVSSSRFFSVAEDRIGNLWFGSIGGGVYRYDGKSFQNFTIKQGLVSDEIGCIYEDRAGNLWFGANGGASLYNGKSIRNFVIQGDSMSEDHTGKSFPMMRPPIEVTSIMEDKKGRLWFATRGNTFVYDGKAFKVFSHNGKPFRNVRSLEEDRDGNIWLAGNDGLWRFNGITCTSISMNFTGYVYEDKKGNIWTSSETSKTWSLSRYEGKSLNGLHAGSPIVTEVRSNEGMIFGIVESTDGNIWFGTLGGVYRYNGTTVLDFKQH